MNDLVTQLEKWTTSLTQEAVTSVIAERLGSFLQIALEYQKKVDVFTFTYESNGKNIAGFLVAPKARGSKLPVIIYNRGGTADFGLTPKGRLFTRFAALAELGYLVVGSQYPGNSTSEGEDERGGASDLESILRLYDLIKELDVADETRIGMFGESRGGMMTYLCMKEVDWIKAALTVGGLANLERSLEYRPEMEELFERHFGNTVSAKDARSAVKWADKLSKNTPLCLLHGGADERVNVRDALEMAEKLEEAGHLYSLHILEGGDHGLMNVPDERDRLVYDWFKKYLKV